MSNTKTTVVLEIDSIIADQRIYPRIGTQSDKTEQYAKAMKKGDVFPIIRAAKINGNWLLVDGYHRLGGRLINRRKYGGDDPQGMPWSRVECQVSRAKTLEEAYVEGIKLNTTHGIPFEPAERMIIATNLSQLGYKPAEISDILRVPAFEVERMVIRAIEKIPTFVKRRIETEDDESPFEGAHASSSETPETLGSAPLESRGTELLTGTGASPRKPKFFMPMYKFDETLVEQLAAVCHQEWVRWSTNWVRYNRGRVSEKRQTYFRSMWVPYQNIPESRKSQFREWAKKVLAVVWAA